MATRVDSKYEADGGGIHPLRLTVPYAEIAGTEPAGPVTDDDHIIVNKGKRKFGITPRHVVAVRVTGTGDASFRRYAKVILRSIADISGATYAPRASITINGNPYTIIRVVQEQAV